MKYLVLMLSALLVSVASAKQCREAFAVAQQIKIKEYLPHEKLTTPNGTHLKIVKFLAEGLRGRVFLAKTSKNNLVVLKVAINDDYETLESISKEPRKVKAVADLGIPHSEILEAGGNFLVKRYVDGELGIDWFRRWVADGQDLADAKLQNILGIFNKISDKSIYLGDLNPGNLIWDSNISAWVIIDSGGTRSDLTPEQALKRFHENFYRRWTKKLGPALKLKSYLGLD